MKTWEYEALRDVRNAIARTIVDEILELLKSHVELNAARLVRAK